MVRDVTGEKPRRQIPKLSQAKVGIWDCAPSMRKVVGFAKTYILKEPCTGAVWRLDWGRGMLEAKMKAETYCNSLGERS